MLGKSTLREHLKDAVARADAKKCGEIAERLRLSAGMTYAEIAERAAAETGIDPREWEALMLEASESE